MARIRTIAPEEADGYLAKVYATVAAKSGEVANILRVESLSPRAMAAHYLLYRELMFGDNPLTRAQRELMAVAVSQANNCEYWLVHHAASFRRAARDDALADAVERDVHSAPLGVAERALVAYAIDLTRSQPNPDPGRMEALKAVGFDDAAVLAATEIVAYFNFVNRMAIGLGVELEA